MSALNSSSTLAEIQAAYDDNASYAEDGSASKARTFITACRLLLRQTPSRAASGGRGGYEVEMDPGLVKDQLDEARRWLAVNDPSVNGCGIVHANFENFRD